MVTSTAIAVNSRDIVSNLCYEDQIKCKYNIPKGLVESGAADKKTQHVRSSKGNSENV